MKTNLLFFTAILGALGIVLGAFGAHALKDVLSENSIKSFETGVRYQMLHVIVLLIVNTTQKLNAKTSKRISFFFLTGIVLFSGSIYALTALKIPAKFIWFVTPIGGLFLITGWILLALAFLKTTKN